MAGKVDLEDSAWCEQVFEGRNKEYGAYELRKNYSRNMRNGNILAILFFTFSLAAPLIVNFIFSEGEQDERVKVIQATELMAPPPVDKTAPPPPPPAEPPPPPVRSAIKFTPPVVKKDEEIRDEEPPPVVEDIKVEVAAVTVEGDEDAPIDIEEPVIGEGNAVVEEEAVYFSVEEAPSFPGGMANIGKYIGKNLKYPTQARDAGIQGRVIVSFIVEKDGSVTDVKVLQGIGNGCDEEAIRVIKLMPPWTPGKQNGKPVRVQYNLPIAFRLD